MLAAGPFALRWVVLASLGSVNPYLAEAKVFYETLAWEKCLRRLDEAAKANSSHQELVEIEVYSGLCAYGSGDRRAALDHFRTALLLDPAAKLPNMTSPKIEADFEAIATKLAASRPAPVPEPPPVTATPPPAPAPAPVVLSAPPPASRPTPVGGIVLGGASLAMLAGGGALGVWALESDKQLVSGIRGESPGANIPQLRSDIRGGAIAADVLLGVGAAGLAASAYWIFHRGPTPVAVSVGPTHAELRVSF